MVKITKNFVLVAILFSLSQAGWDTLAPVPEEVGRGGAITYGRGYVWAIVEDNFYVYDISGDSWDELDVVPSGLDGYGAITFGIGQCYFLGRVYVAARIVGETDQLCVYTLGASGWDGEWNDPEINPIYLPRECGPGVSIAFRPSPDTRRFPLIDGWIYYLPGNGSVELYRLALVVGVQVRIPWHSSNETLFVADPTPIFDWSEIPEASKYQVQVDDNDDFSSPVIDVITENKEYQCTTPLANSFYYWRPRSLDDPSGTWNTTNSFILQSGWERLAAAPQGIDRGGAMCYNKKRGRESLYVLVGNGYRSFYCYSINSDTWFIDTLTPLPQNDGSAIVSGAAADELYAIFGESQNPEKHWEYDLSGIWWSRDDLPAILGPGASLAYDYEEGDGYLIIGGERDGFYVNRNPFGEDEGSQSQGTTLIFQKARISSSSDNIFVHYSIDSPSQVNIRVYDLTGKLVKTLLSGNVKSGEHRSYWDKTDNSGKKVSPGIYFITIDNEGKAERLKAIIK